MADGPNDIAPRIVDGEPVCDRDCPRRWKSAHPLCVVTSLDAPCIPGLRRQRDELTATLAAERIEREKDDRAERDAWTKLIRVSAELDAANARARAAEAEVTKLRQVVGSVSGVLDDVESKPLPVGEPKESVNLGRLQVVDEVRAALAAKGE